MNDDLVHAIVEHNEAAARPAQIGATTVIGRTPSGSVLGSGESQFLSWAEWSGGAFTSRHFWRLGRPEITFASQPRMKEIPGSQ